MILWSSGPFVLPGRCLELGRSDLFSGAVLAMMCCWWRWPWHGFEMHETWSFNVCLKYDFDMFKTWCLSLRYICFICVFLYVKEKQDSDDFSSYGINMNQWSCGVVACRWLVGQLGLGTNLLMAIFGGQSWNHFPVIPPQKKPVASGLNVFILGSLVAGR